MNMNLTTILDAIKHIGPALAGVSSVKAIIEQAIDLLDNDDDQATAKASLADLIAENDEGHQRLQDKLADAAKR
jgi:hypothetical protein